MKMAEEPRRKLEDGFPLLYREGKSDGEIAEILDVMSAQVRYWRQISGLPANRPVRPATRRPRATGGKSNRKNTSNTGGRYHYNCYIE